LDIKLGSGPFIRVAATGSSPRFSALRARRYGLNASRMGYGCSVPSFAL